MALVPVEGNQVAKWKRSDVRQDENPEHEVWMARSEAVPGKKTRVWIRQGSPNLQEICLKYSIPSDALILQSTFCGFVKGRPLKEVATTIKTAGGAQRPTIVYRAVHDGHPFESVKARGFGKRETDPLYFQWMLQRHLVWNCRDESPFMSVTNNYKRALVMAANYAMRSRTGVRIWKIQTDGPGDSWDDQSQRMWHVSYFDGSEFRILEILPAESDRDEDPIACRLTHAFFSAPPDFSALSYVWGDASVTESITVDGEPFQATVNLVCALRHLRRRYQEGFAASGNIAIPTRLWIDAICINQSDIPEKNVQVALMGQLYRAATTVLSWLGFRDGGNGELALASLRAINDAGVELIDRPRLESIVAGRTGTEADDQDLVSNFVSESRFRLFLRRAGLLRLEGDKHDQGLKPVSWDSISALFKLPYWSRMWIIQEIILAKPHSNIFLFPDGNCNREFLEQFRQLTLALRQLFSQVVALAVAAPPSRSGESQTQAVRLISRSSAISIYDILTETAQNAIVPLRKLDSIQEIYALQDPSSILTLPIAANRFNATNPRDEIYALLGLLDQSDIVPDYSLSVKEVHVDWFRKCLETYHSIRPTGYLQPLLEAGMPPDALPEGVELPDLPSWVPRLHPGFAFHPRPKWMGEEFRFGPDIGQQRPLVTDSHSLQVTGALCDEILVVHRINDREDLLKACRAYWDDFHRKEYKTGIGLLRAFFRTFQGGIDGSRAPFDLKYLKPALQPGQARGEQPSVNHFNDDEEDLALAFIHVLTGRTFLSDEEIAAAEEEERLQNHRTGDTEIQVDAGVQEDNDTPCGTGVPENVTQPETDPPLTDLEEFAMQMWRKKHGDYRPDERFWECLYSIHRETEVGQHKMFETRGGYLGNATSLVEPGDKVFLLSGCPSPIVLRRDGDGWLFVGSCYVEGLSHGEGMGMVRDGALVAEGILLH
ncbi:heterokaryon incompatibility protein-domain-containing protein [Podospora appendiculata]|uniref:Heterokaryon incompatibility protein-domain-containing protein n=1 Tax=Podospora appendiculata TaxID=314037 RepID=A0AAE1CCM5_9PEZI|nr:heterokaryon incompatibility protein-domain-containing protein [Podospora appendiculata]